MMRLGSDEALHGCSDILTPMSQMYLRSTGQLPRELPNLVFVIPGHVEPRRFLNGHACILKSSNKTPEQTGISRAPTST